MIVHLGLDTIELGGKGFERLATEGDEVEAGQPIVRFDLETITPVVVTNPEEHPVSGAKTGEVTAADVLFEAA